MITKKYINFFFFFFSVEPVIQNSEPPKSKPSNQFAGDGFRCFHWLKKNSIYFRALISTIRQKVNPGNSKLPGSAIYSKNAINGTIFEAGVNESTNRKKRVLFFWDIRGFLFKRSFGLFFSHLN